MAYKRAFVSDIHMTWGKSLVGSILGPDKSNKYEWLDLDEATQTALFLEQLPQTGVNEVILLGDIMDDWLYPHDIDLPSYADIAAAQHVQRIIKAINNLPGATYVAGNHDMAIMSDRLSSFRTSTFPNAKFTTEAYETDGIYAEHGNRYNLWNDNDEPHIVPIGYYITRLGASVNAYTDGTTHTIPQLVGALSHMNSLVDDPLIFLKEQLDGRQHAVSGQTVVGTCADPAVCRTFDGVLDTYKDLPGEWQQKHNGDIGFMAPWKSVLYEIQGLQEVALELVFKSNTRKAIVFGHTHRQELVPIAPMKQDPEHMEYWGIYANCGCWCEFNAARSQPYSWVLIESEGDSHTVSLMNWDWRKRVSTTYRKYTFPFQT